MTADLLLVRAPSGRFEEELVRCFSPCPAVDEIWVRDIHRGLGIDTPILRVWFGLTRHAKPQDREMLDRLQIEYCMHRAHDDLYIEYRYKPQNKIPTELPSCIWRRPLSM
jgi:hypothetical protein